MTRQDRRSTNAAIINLVKSVPTVRNMNMMIDKIRTGRPKIDAIFDLFDMKPTRRAMINEEMADRLLRQSSMTIMITADTAGKLLECPMYNQRPKNKAQQERLSDYMLNDKFGRGNSLSFAVLPNGDTELIDGQNRLGAIHLSGRPVSINMAFIPCKNESEIKAEAMRTDNHNTRGNSDHAMIAGVPEWFLDDPQYINHPVPTQWSKAVVGASKTLIRSGVDPKSPYRKKDLRDPDRKMEYLRYYWEKAPAYLNTCVYGTKGLSPSSERVKNLIRQKTFLEGPFMGAGLLIFDYDSGKAEQFYRILGSPNNSIDANGPLGGIDAFITRKNFDGTVLCAPGAQSQFQTIYALCRAFLAYRDNEDMSEGELKSIIRWKMKHSPTPNDPFDYQGCKTKKTTK